MIQSTAVPPAPLPGLIGRGKVRDLYDLGERLMIVASDRISAFDVVMNEPVPGKGAVLTRMSRFWLNRLPACQPHHLEYVVGIQGETSAPPPPGYEAHAAALAGRAMVVRKAVVVPVECVVRGYVVGGGWKEYQATGSVSGVPLRPELRLADALPEPIFTPSTKAERGHDEPISFDGACRAVAEAAELSRRLARELAAFARADTAVGVTMARLLDWSRSVMTLARRRSLDIYAQAAAHAATRGIIIADTKFEFGLHDGHLLLIDEVLTPDSSRFWPADGYRPGSNPPSFDKQFLRDYLEGLDWNKQPPPPPIPAEIIEKTRQRYEEACQRLVA